MSNTVNPKRRNLLLRVIAVQEVYDKQKIHDGVTITWIYKTHIYPAFYISRSTFLKYLDMNAKKELRQIEEYLKQKESCEPSESENF